MTHHQLLKISPKIHFSFSVYTTNLSQKKRRKDLQNSSLQKIISVIEQKILQHIFNNICILSAILT